MKLITETTKCDFCVVGGGISGVCAAIAAARRGLKVVLMQERPVLGGNASSEIRMWICGCKGLNNRETGILEELQLESLYRNPYKLYPVWDSLIYNMVISEPNITLMLNCSCCNADMDKDKIKAVYGWQMTSQTWQKVEA
ncbi:MAG TPA: FAD-dependent oxidoreductase, partial [Clostridia bacterium]|nr:FAD-dependent oxidoreductase [Clostridia bacterium]